MSEHLTEDEKGILLRLAREALERGVRREALFPLDLTTLTPLLQSEGASFVTLTEHGQLRGCIGALQPYQPLAEDVREHAIAAALDDHRFPPVQPRELVQVKIEISRLTVPKTLAYDSPEDLLSKLHPGLDGIILQDKSHRGTFLPQVWEKIPDKAAFMDELCAKMGARRDLWRQRHLDVLVYQVEEFHEK